MFRQNNRASRTTPLFETLESRCLLSASPMMDVSSPAPHVSATHAKPTVPTLTGAAFTGTATSANSSDGSTPLTVTFATEGKSGKVTGTFQVDDHNGTNTFNFTGNVNVKGKLTLHAKGSTGEVANLTGTVSADGKTITGKFVSTRPHHKADHGTFTITQP